jgi:hypothetical protein
MGDTKALFASLGAGITLVATAALALLTISAVFAFGGWSNPVSEAVTKPALVFEQANPSGRDGARILARSGKRRIVAPAPRAVRAERRTARPASTRTRARARPAATSVSAPGSGTAPALELPVVRRPAAPTVAAPPAPKTGDHVRKVGDTLSAVVQDTGTALADATQQLAPPVSAAVQQVLNIVADVVRRTTDGLGNTLDALLPPKR